MKKLTLLLIASLLPALLFVGCGKKEEASAPQTVEEAGKAANQSAGEHQDRLQQAASQAEKEAEQRAKEAEAEARKAIKDIQK
ncbi:MAG: hypothetical protein KJT03_15900 [Verrucomicrobiae bacterium]|nr:hypothetical protein [Verrucomicrobiae bacterium]